MTFMRSIGAGDLRERVEIWANDPATLADDHGVRESEPRLLATFWARITPQGASPETKRGGQVNANTGYLVDLRYTEVCASLGPTNSIVWRSKRLSVSGVTVWPTRDFLTLTCLEAGV